MYFISAAYMNIKSFFSELKRIFQNKGLVWKISACFVFLSLFLCLLIYFRNGKSFVETTSLPQGHLIVLGGASDPMHHICSRIISSKVPKDRFSYFQWYQFADVCKFIESLQDHKGIILLGHSWGGADCSQSFQ